MRVTEYDRDEFVEDHFPNMVAIREWSECKVWSAGVDAPLLILFDKVNCRTTVCEYDSRLEREIYIKLVLRFRDGDEEAGARVPAVPTPVPPGKTASAALPLPQKESD